MFLKMKFLAIYERSIFGNNSVHTANFVLPISVFQLYLVNFKWLKFIPPTANSCYLGQNISWGQKIFQKFWFLDIPMSCQSFLKNHLVKWPFSVAIWSGKRKFNFLYFFNFKQYFCFVGVKSIWELWPFKVHHLHIDQKLSKWEGG